MTKDEQEILEKLKENLHVSINTINCLLEVNKQTNTSNTVYFCPLPGCKGYPNPTGHPCVDPNNAAIQQLRQEIANLTRTVKELNSQEEAIGSYDPPPNTCEQVGVRPVAPQNKIIRQGYIPPTPPGEKVATRRGYDPPPPPPKKYTRGL